MYNRTFQLRLCDSLAKKAATVICTLKECVPPPAWRVSLVRACACPVAACILT